MVGCGLASARRRSGSHPLSHTGQDSLDLFRLVQSFPSLPFFSEQFPLGEFPTTWGLLTATCGPQHLAVPPISNDPEV